MKKRLWTIFVLIVVLAIGICTLAACVVTPPASEPENPPEEPVDNKLTYLGDLSKALAETAAMNPEDGFLMDLAANVAWNFKDSEKASLYNWSYGLNIKANVFVDGETRQGLMIELTDTYPGRFTDEQKAAGEDVLFGLYNTTDENLYVKVGKNASYRFDRVGVSTALKSVLKTNGVDLDINLKDVKVGEYGKVGDFLEAAMPLLSSVFDKVDKDGNNYVLDFKYSKLYEFVAGLLKEAKIDLSELPEIVTNVLPKEMTFQAVVKTDGKYITGIDVKDAVMETKDGEGDGTFNMTSDFTLFGQPAETLDIEASVAQSLKEIPAVKILNVNTYGDIAFEKIVMTETPDEPGTGEPTEPGAETPAAAATTKTTVTRTISWELRANLDLFKLIEKNFVFDDEIFEDNFLHLRLSLDGLPFLDLAYAPSNLGTSDFVVVANLKTLLNALVGEIDLGGQKQLIGDYFAENFGLECLSVPINTTALGYMISGKGGKVEKPVPATTWYQPAVYEDLSAADENGEAIDPEAPTEPEIPAGIEGIIDLVKKIVTVGGGELDVNLDELFKALKLDASATDLIDNLTKDANNVAFRNNVFQFAKAENAIYDTAKAVCTNADGSDRELLFSGVGLASAIEFETNEGYLWVKSANGEEEKEFKTKTDPVTLEQLNSFVGNSMYSIGFSGKDFYGNSFEAPMMGGAMITGYLGLDPTLIGKKQTIEVVTGFPDQTAIILIVQLILPSMAGSIEGLDLDPIFELLGQLKVGRFKADVVLSEAVASADLYNLSTGENLDVTQYYDVFNTGKSGDYGVRVELKYLANDAFPTETVVTASEKLDDLKYNPVELPVFYVEEQQPFEVLQRESEYKYALGGQGDVTLKIKYRGVSIDKTYRFTPIEEAAVELRSEADGYVLQGSAMNFVELAEKFTISGVYDSGTADVSDDVSLPKFRLIALRDSTIEIVNFKELTGRERSDYHDVNGISPDDDFTFINTGVAEVRVNLSDVYMGTVYIAVLPASENATIADITYKDVPAAEGGAAIVTMDGNLRFDLKGSLSGDRKASAVKARVNGMRNGTAIDLGSDNFTIGGVKYDGIAGAILELPAEESSVCFPFSMTGLPEGTDNIVLTIELTYVVNNAQILKLNQIACFTGLNQTATWASGAKKGSTIPVNCLELRFIGSAEKYQIAWDGTTKKYVFKQSEKTNIAAEVGVYDGSGGLIEGGINATTGKIDQNGTLRVSVMYENTTYTIEKIV